MPALLKKPIAWLVMALIAVALIIWLMGALSSGSKAKVETRLNANRGDAAVLSGQDAVNTVADQAATETDIDRKVNNATEQVRGAGDAAGADAAGRDGLCRLSRDLCPKGTVQQPDPR